MLALSCKNIDRISFRYTEDKFYMLYKDGNMYLDKEWNLDNYKITTIEKDKNRYLAKTLGGKEVKLLLRWKNCKGVAYHIQIS